MGAAYHRSVETRRFTLSRRQRRRTEIPVVIVTVLLCGLPCLADWRLALFLSAIWLTPVLCVVPPGLYGSTELTAHGLRLRTPYRRRFVPWHQITDITIRERDGKGGPRKYAVAHRVTGRPVVLPGLCAYRGDRPEWDDLDIRVNVLRDYRRRVGTA